MTEKARKQIAEIFKIVGTDSVLVVTKYGKLKRLNCPFGVICITEVYPLCRGKKYMVESVKMTIKLEDVFIINGKAYFVWYFQIIV